MTAASLIWRAFIMSALVPVGVSATNTVSLSNFIPRIENLPQQCQSVYTKTIQGCQESDFTSSAGCGSSCTTGLVAITREVTRACSNVDVPETSIIGVFLLGLGIQTLCPNVEVTTIPASSAAPTQPARPPPTSQAKEATSTVSSRRQTSAAPQSSSTGGIAIDPSVPTDATTLETSIATSAVQSDPAPPADTALPQSSSAIAAPAQPTANSQKSNAESGGGSPFDVVAEGGTSQLQHLSNFAITWILGTAALFTFLL